MTTTSIETMTGQFVDLVKPDPKTIDIRDIAWATSRMPRYVGHTISAIPYTIGQHSIFVTMLVVELFRESCVPDLRRSFVNYVNERCAADEKLHQDVLDLFKKPVTNTLLLELLMHDASEAYVVDVPTPLKESEGFKQVYTAIEEEMMAAIRERFNMGTMNYLHGIVLKWADRVALNIEAHHLIRSRGANWTRLLPLDMTSMQLFQQPKEAIQVYQDFLAWFDELTVRP